MTIPFTKMHGLGNDFMVVRGDGLDLPAPARIQALADRRRGVGFDQLLWLEAPYRPGDDIGYRVFNADGSEAGQCGNGARCIARLLAGEGRGILQLGHAGGSLRAEVHADGRVTLEMAVPVFDPPRVPFVADRQAPRYTLDAGDATVEVGVVSMGNPHAVIEVASVDDAPVAVLGPLLERHARFPQRANIGFMQVVSRNRVRLRVHERGAGETAACGTGACAAVAVGRLWQCLDAQVRVELPGGVLDIRWQGPDDPLWMTGEAVTVYQGVIDA